jgi:hypothetical protein
MSEAIDLSKEKNFFETRMTEYKIGGAIGVVKEKPFA